MYYGDQQAYYTNMRASFGPYGGALASGSMAGGGQYYGGPEGGGPGGEVSGLAYMGAQVRPITYMPQARMFVPGSGMYQQETPGLFPSLGRMVGYIEVPRNVSVSDYRSNAATDVGERIGTNTAAAGIAFAGTSSAGFIGAPIGAAAGRVIGAGVGGLMAAPFGLAPVGGLAGGFIGGAVGGLVGGMGAMQVAGDVTDLIVQQRQLRNYLETATFRSTTASSAMADFRRGQGMGVGARQATSEMITAMDVADPLMDTEDLTRVLQGAVGMGLMNNTNTVDDFKRKFKDITENLKLVVRTMNSTLEEGIKTMQEFRGIGVTDAGTVGDLVVRSSVAGRVAGRTTQEMVSIGLQGAEMFRGTGVSMNIGYQAAINNAASVRAAQDAGTLSQEAVAQAGGVEALAQRMTVGGLAFAQTGLGRGMGAAFFQPGGGLDQGAMDQFLTGQGPGFIGIAQKAARTISSPQRLMEFQARQAKFVSQIGEMYGGQGLQLFEMHSAMASAKFHQQVAPGTDTETAFRFALQNLGKSEPEIEAMIGIIRNADKSFVASQKSAGVERDRMAMEQAYQNLPLTRWSEKYIEDPYLRVRNLIAKPVNKLIDSVVEGTKNVAETAFIGFERASLSGVNLDIGKEAALLEDIRQGPARARSRRQQLESMEINLDEVGTFAYSAGETALSAIKGGALSKSLGIGPRDIPYATAFQGVVLNENPLTGARQGITHQEAKDLENKTRVFRMTVGDAGKVREAAGDEYTKTVARLRSRSTEVDVRRMDFPQAVLTLTGKKRLEDVTRVEYAAIVNEFGENERTSQEKSQFASGIEAARVEAQTLGGLGNNIAMKTMQELSNIFEETRSTLSKRYANDLAGEKIPDGVLELVAVAADTSLKPEEREKAVVDATLALTKANPKLSTVRARAIVEEMIGGGGKAQEAAIRTLSTLGLSREDEAELLTAGPGKAVSILKRLAKRNNAQVEAFGPTASQKQDIGATASRASGEAKLLRKVTDIEVEQTARALQDVSWNVGELRKEKYRDERQNRLVRQDFLTGPTLLDRVAEDKRQRSSIMGPVTDALAYIREFQATSGARARVDQLRLNMDDMKAGTERGFFISAVDKLAVGPEALKDLSAEEIGALSANNGGDIAKAATRIQGVEKYLIALDSAKSDVERGAAKKKLLSFLKEDYGEKGANQIIDLASSKGSESVISALSREAFQAFSPQDLSTQAGGGANATQTGTAAEAYTVQTDINRSIFNSLEILHSQLAAMR